MTDEPRTLGEIAETALRVVRETKELTYDTETSGVDWKRNSVVGYVITDSQFNGYIPVRHGGGGNLLDPNCHPLRTPEDKAVVHQWEVELARAFDLRRQRGLLTIGHHILFDQHMSYNHGINLGRMMECTQNNAAMLDEYARSYSLENTARAANVTAKKGQELYDHLAQQFGGKNDHTAMANYWQLSGQDPLANEYALGDGITTMELRAWQIQQIRAEEMGRVHELESRLIYTIFRIERRGIKADVSRIAEVETEVAKQLARGRMKLPANFNVRSGPQIRKWLEEKGRTNWPMTEPSKAFPDGQPSFTEKWLKTFAEGEAIIDVRKLTNLGNSFITPLKERHIFNERVHSSLNQLKSDEFGTISGRFSSSNPNLQQIPKRDEDLGRLFRSIFVPDDGMEFYEADYSQCEPRLFAHYSNEPALVDGYSRNPPIDVHTIVAENFNTDRKVTAKRMNMGIFTGMQVDSLAAHMGWTKVEAQEKFNQWFNLFPAVADFQKRAKNVLKSTGYVRTLLGRRCRLEASYLAYRGTSKIIQGGNADIMKEKMLECDVYLEGEGDLSHLLMSVHDALEWQAPKGAVGEAQSAELIRMCCDVQGPPFNLRVPFTMDVGKGPNWAIATYGELPAST